MKFQANTESFPLLPLTLTLVKIDSIVCYLLILTLILDLIYSVSFTELSMIISLILLSTFYCSVTIDKI
jgi:hypothetical protein